MLFNFVGGFIQEAGPYHVDISLLGTTVIDQIFESTTYVDQLDEDWDSTDLILPGGPVT